MRIIYILLLVCLISCKENIPYKQIVFKEQSFILSVPDSMNEGRLRTIGNELELIRTYVPADSACFIILDLSKKRNENISELLEVEKRKLPFNYMNSVLLSTSIDSTADIKRAGVNFKSGDSGENINNITIYDIGEFIVKTDIHFRSNYDGKLGKDKEIIRRVTQSLSIIK